jgi:NodT family efflux transporter outer membrane factor (OMF) lipoprotein
MKTRHRRWTIVRPAASLLMMATVIVGCTLGPDPERPVTAADVSETYVYAADDEGSLAGQDNQPVWPAETYWWQRFGDETTAELVELALTANTDLQAAAARVLEAEALLEAAGGARLPQVDYGLSANRSRNSFVLEIPKPGDPSVSEKRRITPESTTYGTDLGVSWQADLFGKLKRSQQSTWASLLAEEAARDAVLHTVVASVVRTRVQVATLERALDIARNIRTSWESTTATVERRYRNGLVGAVDLYLARENLASARAAEAALEGSAATARNALDVLVGRRPGTGARLPRTLPELPSVDPVPLGLPAELLDRRPDLRQSEMRLAAATYGIGVALADLYPSLSLTAAGGTRSDTLADLISSETFIYNAVANLVGPLFTGGQRRANVAAARARTEQAAATYAGAVLQALREVEDALVLEASVREQLAHNDQRVADARSANRMASERYQRGVETLLYVLETERRLRLAEEAWISSQADLWNARIELFLALGGDWEPSSGVPDGAQRSASVSVPGTNPIPQTPNPKPNEVS